MKTKFGIFFYFLVKKSQYEQGEKKGVSNLVIANIGGTRGRSWSWWYVTSLAPLHHFFRPPTPAGHFKTPLPHVFPRFLLLPFSLFSLFLRRRSQIPVTPLAGDPLFLRPPSSPFRFESFPALCHHESRIVSANSPHSFDYAK